jgi:hypothetical protein
LNDNLAPVANTSQPPIITAPDNALKLTEKELSRAEGLYWNPVADNVRRVYIKDGKLMYLRAAGNESELVPVGPNRFLMVGVRSYTEIEFKYAKNGAPSEMTFYEKDRKPLVQDRKPLVQKYVRSANYTPEELTQLAGRYFSPELNATFTIKTQGDKLVIHTGNWGDFLLTARFFDSFANTDEMGTILFTRNSKHALNGFTLRSGKVRSLQFDKVK